MLILIVLITVIVTIVVLAIVGEILGPEPCERCERYGTETHLEQGDSEG